MNSKPSVEKDEGPVVRDGRYQIPKFESLFAYHTNPLDKNTALVNKWMDWMFQFSLLSKDYYDKKIRCTCLMTASYFYPFCKDVSRYQRLVKWLAYLYISDDFMDVFKDTQETRIMLNQTIDCIKRLEAVYVRGENHNISTLGFEPFVICVYSIVEDILIDYNMEQRKRFLKLFHSYCVACNEENELIEKQILDFDEVKRIRLDSGAVTILISQIEYSQKIYITGEEWKEPRFQRLIDVGNLCTVFVNDLYSFEKEYLDQKGDMKKLIVNIVGFHVLKYNCSIEAAMEKSLHIIKEHEREYKELSDGLINDQSVSADVKNFVECLTALIGGNFGFTIRCKRYNNIYGSCESVTIK